MEPQEDPTRKSPSTDWTRKEEAAPNLFSEASSALFDDTYFHLNVAFIVGKEMKTESKWMQRTVNYLSVTVLFICMGLLTFQKVVLFAFHVDIEMLDKEIQFFKRKLKLK